jgi:hypothetical protein
METDNLDIIHHWHLSHTSKLRRNMLSSSELMFAGLAVNSGEPISFDGIHDFSINSNKFFNKLLVKSRQYMIK